jgi:uncharacterized protein YqeY
VITQPAEIWRALLRRSLTTARKQRDTVRVSALRCALAAIDNAETPDAVAVAGRPSGAIAGAVAGLGATEVARRELSDEQIRSLVRAEIDERLSAADDFTAGGHASRAAALRAEATVLADLLGDV